MPPRNYSARAQSHRHAPARASVIVVADADSRPLRRTLQVLGRQTRAEHAELILVFSAWPDDLSAESRRTLTPLVNSLLFEPRPGRSVALNTAVHAALSDVIALVGVHVHISDGWLSALLAPMDEDADLAGVGAPVEPIYPVGKVPHWYRRMENDPVASFLLPVHHMGPSPCEYSIPPEGHLRPLPLGSNSAWRREWLLKFPFDESLAEKSEGCGWGAEAGDGEDALFARQTIQGGGRVAYAPRAIVFRPMADVELAAGSALEWSKVRGQKYARVMRALGKAPRETRDPGTWASNASWAERMGRRSTKEASAHLQSFASGAHSESR